MGMASRYSGTHPLPNQLSIRVVMGLFTFSWLVGAGQTGLCVSIRPTQELGLSLGWMSELSYGLLNSQVLSAALVLCSPGEE